MKIRKNLEGEKFGRLTVIKFYDGNIKGRYKWECLCECGNSSYVERSDLTTGKVLSCGCLKSEITSNRLVDDLTGKIFNDLKVVSQAGRTNAGKVKWNCVCVCGNNIVASGGSLKRGQKSCGKCGVRNTGSAAYKSWEAMRQRCLNPNSTHYEYYGGRGITIDESWGSFEVFYADMGERPEGYTLERIDCNLGYSKENCKWDTRSNQSYNTRMQVNNTSGKTGVTWSEKDGRWLARIGFQGKQINLGSFIDYDSAVKARQAAEIKYFGFLKDKPVGVGLRKMNTNWEPLE